ncbi:hypothetical protein GFY24_03415 [Nocardia sp. SYP-A9097]|uniref:hypothetical protein n=1 Tax=Nocardia sp. SYP-A9097 TaxID=2663237 RepID=UPI00129B9D7B|nr:hypothetical protein [Nocardia sp. SYP-A9097]MRH86529.1 hypothetical protein [Nocardia sp. SYP-A9097]
MPAGRSPRIQITGRARAGKSTVRNALSLMTAEETSPIDAPEQADPILDADLFLYILPGTLTPADRRALAPLAPDRTLVILNKADAIGHRWSDAAQAADRHTETLGLLTLPAVASLAARTRAGTFTEADLKTLRRHHGSTDPAFTLTPDIFADPVIAEDDSARRSLLDRWDLYGVSCALAALRRAPDLAPQPLLQILHSASGMDPIYRALHERYEQAVAAIARESDAGAL